ncbi:MAG TPA: SiaB family protein kinase [Bacteroidia bacterium]|jgi:hypothetical protein
MDKTGDIFSVGDWSRFLEEEDLILSFKGEFTQELINAILLLSDSKEQLNERSNVIKNRIFAVIVECLQNICKHGADDLKRSEIRPGIILIGKQGHTALISTGNLLLNSEVDALKQKIDHLKSLQPDDVKKLAKEILLTGTLSSKSGAGLGLITIIRKSQKVEYSITKIDEELSFFAIEVSVSTLVK